MQAEPEAAEAVDRADRSQYRHDTPERRGGHGHAKARRPALCLAPR
jgi:hypothetical protein